MAKLAGVSRSTVSRVVNNYPNLSTETKKKVTEIIRKCGYMPMLQPEPLLVNLIR
jgi:LacI family transcriptional regulator